MPLKKTWQSMLQVADKAMLFHFAVYLLRFKRTSNLIRAFLRPVEPTPPHSPATQIASSKAERCVGGSESKQRQRGSRRTNNSPGRCNTAVPQVNSPSGLDCVGKAACPFGPKVHLFGQCANGLMDAWTFCICHTVQTNRTHTTQASKQARRMCTVLDSSLPTPSWTFVLCFVFEHEPTLCHWKCSCRPPTPYPPLHLCLHSNPVETRVRVPVCETAERGTWEFD